MKVFFDSNVYVAEALLGPAAQELIQATERAAWRIYADEYLIDEVARVLTQKLGFSRRLATLAQRRIVRRAKLIRPPVSRHRVPADPKDSPILKSALACGADFLVTNDTHLLELDPYEGLRIISMNVYRRLLIDHGLLRP